MKFNVPDLCPDAAGVWEAGRAPNLPLDAPRCLLRAHREPGGKGPCWGLLPERGHEVGSAGTAPGRGMRSPTALRTGPQPEPPPAVGQPHSPRAPPRPQIPPQPLHHPSYFSNTPPLNPSSPSNSPQLLATSIANPPDRPSSPSGPDPRLPPPDPFRNGPRLPLPHSPNSPPQRPPLTRRPPPAPRPGCPRTAPAPALVKRSPIG